MIHGERHRTAHIGWLRAAVLGLLGLLGTIAARLGGARSLRGAMRVAFWGAVAMGVTAVIGRLFGTLG